MGPGEVGLAHSGLAPAANPVALVLPARLLQKRLAREAKELEKLEKAAAKVGAGRLLGGIGGLLLEMETENAWCHKCF